VAIAVRGANSYDGNAAGLTVEWGGLGSGAQMAASATNTSREMGAVFGVAILGAVVNATLTGGLAVRLKQIGAPPSFQNLVLHAVQTGGAGGSAATSA